MQVVREPEDARPQRRPGRQVPRPPVLFAQALLDGGAARVQLRYRFDDAMLIEAEQPRLLRNSILIALLVFLLTQPLLSAIGKMPLGLFLALIVAFLAGYWFFHAKRETIKRREGDREARRAMRRHTR